MQQPTIIEQTRLEEEVGNEMILEEQDVDALREAEAEADGALNPGEVVELLLEELLLSVVRKKIADDDASSDDFFSQDSPAQLQHLAPCSQDFAFFKVIEQTREDLTTEEDESQEESDGEDERDLDFSRGDGRGLKGARASRTRFVIPKGYA